jgi:hypothetical protein
MSIFDIMRSERTNIRGEGDIQVDLVLSMFIHYLMASKS